MNEDSCALRKPYSRQTQYQQDDYGIFELPLNLHGGDLLLVLADGMGGERAGDRCDGDTQLYRCLCGYSGA
ncbi:MAG: hypothetical protein R3F37_14045 [Candidatus Competibacteraceae bacterium]